ncbi:MAG: miniconductance mechanosensitive channel [Planctomycetota bacterium]|jgi:miniconductance mechanosensitive channel
MIAGCMMPQLSTLFLRMAPARFTGPAPARFTGPAPGGTTPADIGKLFQDEKLAQEIAAAKNNLWLPEGTELWIEQTLDIGALLVVVLLVSWATRALRKLVIVPLIKRSKNTLDDVFVDKAFFRWISYLPPTLIAAATVSQFPGLHPSLPNSETIVQVVRQLLTAMTTISGMLAVGALIDSSHEIYARKSGPKQRPIKGYVSLIKIFIYVLGTVAAVAWAFGKDPSGLLTGIATMTAVLMLIFKDTILSLVASITLTQNDMIRLGDWIEMPGGPDGDVVDMALHTVKIQNFDCTITTVPTIDLVNKPFKNWRNMSEGTGRRIKRSLLLDGSSVRFLNKDEVDRFGKMAVLKDYIAGKRTEIETANKQTNASTPALEVRRLTNIGTFRAYVYQWLRQHPRIHQNMTLLVRQMPPSPQGLPLEIYAFTNTTAWGEYEEIMADLFDFLLAAVHEFDLALFQSPTGEDLRTMGSAAR